MTPLFSALIWGAPQWWAVVFGVLGVTFVVTAWGYARAGANGRVRFLCATLKTLGFAALALSLVEPMLTGSRPKSGANAFAVVVDDSQSLQVHDAGSSETRGDWVKNQLAKDEPWSTRLAQDFDVRRYAFDSSLRAVDNFSGLKFDGNGTALNSSLSSLSGRFRGLPLAGVLLFTDGNRTDAGDVDRKLLPPIYPVIPPSKQAGKDVAVSKLSVTQANFEAAPVVVRAEVNADGYDGKTIFAVVTDESGRDLERQEAKATGDRKPLNFRFQFRPEKKGVSFYRVRAYAEGEEADASAEQTAANNSRLAVVDQGSGPYRVLYVGGRPGWEFKFLKRALAEDDQVRLVGLIRIAKRQPKFDFRDARTRGQSELFKGFDNVDPDTAERADQPVLMRLDTEDEVELRDGFPKTAEELFRYHAIVIDDTEAAFFTGDQLALLRNFVSVRGGGLLMLGGADSFADGKYDRTPVGELLPVYLNKTAAPIDPSSPGQNYRLVLTREGWLQPWVRTRKTEDDERQRLAGMPAFQTLNVSGEIKPGAVVLADVTDASGAAVPALAVQAFGKGHVAALLIGDLWRWGLRRGDPAEDDLDRSWRQTVRWLVGDVPDRVEIGVKAKDGAPATAVELTTRVRDSEYRPLDNAKVTVKITQPDGQVYSLDAEPVGREPGAYAATYVPKQPGAFRAVATAVAPDGSALGAREAGWASQPAADEFARLEPDRAYLEKLAKDTGGEVVDGSRLAAFASSLSARSAPISEPWTSPLWHTPWYFLAAVVFLSAEWGVRRINGLA